MIAGNNGVLTKTTDAKVSTEKAKIIEEVKLKIFEQIASNLGEKITDEQLASVLDIYFNNVSYDFTDLDNEMTTKNGNYTVKLSEVITDANQINNSTYNVIFNTNGGSTVQSATVAFGETITKPTDPTKEGYIFEGWYKDQNFSTAFSFNLPVIEKLTLYAKWKFDMSDFYIQATGEYLHSYPKFKLYGNAHGMKIYLDGSQYNGIDWCNDIQGMPSIAWVSDENGNRISDKYSFDWEALCFAEDTIVHTKQGTKKISDLKIEDEVWTYNEGIEKIELQKISKVYVHRVSKQLLEIDTEKSGIYCTNLHPFYVESKGWKKAKDIKLNDYLFGINSQKIEIKNKKDINEDEIIKVYNLEVENNHNYFVGAEGILVHNAPDAPASELCSDTSIKVYGEIITD